MNSYEEIQLVIKGSLAKIYLNRPNKLNAYTPDMGDEIIHAYRTLESDKNIKVIAFLGNGKSFCSGADKDYLIGNKLSKVGLKIGEDEFIKSFVTELCKSTKILVAGLHGSCVGIGITMVLPFDIRIAAKNTKISFPFLRLGILPGFASSYYLPLLIGKNKAKEIILTNADLTADESKNIGLINTVIDDNSIEDEIATLASTFDGLSVNSLQAAKKFFHANLEESIQNAINNERNLYKSLT